MATYRTDLLFVYFIPLFVFATHLPQETISVGIYQENISIADTSAQTQSLQCLADIVTRSGSHASVSPNIAAVKFHKNLW